MSEKQNIIDTVPGITPNKSEINPTHHRQIIRDIDFKGDPRRVLGHPSNTHAEIANAYTEHLNDRAVEVGKIANGTQIEVVYDASDETAIEVSHE